jgi:geranylgeranyl pyrophosphate synthase
MTQPLVRQPEPTAQPESERVADESDFIKLLREELEEPCLSRTLDAKDEQVHSRHWHAVLRGPLLELLSRDGKGFRSRMVQVAYALGAGPSGEMPRRLPLIVEALHTGSLIIDDIEDGSKYRRGKPALHLVVGLPLALNAGNWLYFMPHRLLEQLRLPAAVELELRRAIDRAVLRCHYGQALDLGVRLGALGQSEVFDVVNLSTRLKTGSLLELAAEIGATAGGADARRHERHLSNVAGPQGARRLAPRQADVALGLVGSTLGRAELLPAATSSSGRRARGAAPRSIGAFAAQTAG